MCLVPCPVLRVYCHITQLLSLKVPPWRQSGIRNDVLAVGCKPQYSSIPWRSCQRSGGEFTECGHTPQCAPPLRAVG